MFGTARRLDGLLLRPNEPAPGRMHLSRAPRHPAVRSNQRLREAGPAPGDLNGADASASPLHLARRPGAGRAIFMKPHCPHVQPKQLM